MHGTQGQSAWLHKRSLAGYSRALQGGQIHPGCLDVDGGDDDDGGGYDGRDSIYHFRSCVTAHPTCFIQMTAGDGKYILTRIYL